MPPAGADGPHADYGRFPERIERDWLGRWCHLSEADPSLVRRRTGDVTRLGFAARLATVRAIGTFLADPTAVPPPVAVILARQLDIADPGGGSLALPSGVSRLSPGCTCFSSIYSVD